MICEPNQDPKHWRSYLTSAELADLGGLEANVAGLDRKRRGLIGEVRRIRDRCIQRRRYERQRQAERATLPSKVAA